MEKEHKRQTHTNCVFIAVALVFPCRCCVPCVLCLCRWTMQCVLAAAQTHRRACSRPPGGAGVGRGGWHGVAHAWDSYIYLIFYTFIHIANSSNLHMEMINVDKHKG